MVPLGRRALADRAWGLGAESVGTGVVRPGRPVRGATAGPCRGRTDPVSHHTGMTATRPDPRGGWTSTAVWPGEAAQRCNGRKDEGRPASDASSRRQRDEQRQHVEREGGGIVRAAHVQRGSYHVLHAVLGRGFGAGVPGQRPPSRSAP